MIGKITGILESVAPDYVLIDVNGIGYEVFCPVSINSYLPETGETVSLYTDLLVREDMQQLTGFVTLSERELYRELLNVQGIGAKAALSIVGTIGVQDTVQAISLDDWQSLKAAPFVGPKSAQRIVLELKGKIQRLIELAGESGPVVEPKRPKKMKPAKGRNDQPQTVSLVRSEALSALLNLGYSQNDAARVVATSLQEGSDKTVEDVIRESLQILATN